MSIHLVGGGWAAEHYPHVYGQFVVESIQRAKDSGHSDARVGVIQLYESTAEEGMVKYGQFAEILTQLGAANTVPLLQREGDALRRGLLDDLDGLVVAGGLTPAYLTAVTPVMDEVKELVTGGTPYLGFSAGAAIAAKRAVIGGWRIGDLVIGNEESAENLDQLMIADGPGLVDFAVDVHAAQWGNVTRLIMAVTTERVDRGVAIDESTVCIVNGDLEVVAGAGQA